MWDSSRKRSSLFFLRNGRKSWSFYGRVAFRKIVSTYNLTVTDEHDNYHWSIRQLHEYRMVFGTKHRGVCCVMVRSEDGRRLHIYSAASYVRNSSNSRFGVDKLFTAPVELTAEYGKAFGFIINDNVLMSHV